VLAKLLENYADLEVEKTVERASLDDVADQIRADALAGGFVGNLELRQEDGGLRVIVTDQVLFDSGQAVLRPDGLTILDVVGNALKPLDNQIVIEGHTDSDPIKPGGYYTTNLQLSTDRAVAVTLYFSDVLGLDGPSLTPAGRADWEPLATNATSEGKAKNRRVEILVESKLKQKTLDANGLGEDPVAAADDPIEAPVDTRFDGGIDLPVPALRNDR
jgi:chemotaxis protein MotB